MGLLTNYLWSPLSLHPKAFAMLENSWESLVVFGCL